MSPNTIESYSTAFEILLAFAHKQLKKAPSKLLLEELDAPFICRFLDHPESDRSNTARTRNVRLAAIRSFFKYLAFRKPRHSALIQRVLDIPTKRWEKKPVDFLPSGRYRPDDSLMSFLEGLKIMPSQLNESPQPVGLWGA